MGVKSRQKVERRQQRGRIPLNMADMLLAGENGLPARQCGECTVCCTVDAVGSLGKPHHCDCNHLVSGGCGIYESRPKDCAGYYCVWRMGFGTEADRPDRSGVLIDATPDRIEKGFHAVEAIELRPSAFETMFPPPVPVDLIKLLPGPEFGRWMVIVTPFGTPRAWDSECAEEYKYKQAVTGKEILVGGRLEGGHSLCINMGIEDGASMVHMRNGVIMPFEAVKATSMALLRSGGRS